MLKIGLVTLWAKNYGSALQCYALKSEIEKNGYNCEVIGEGVYGLGKYKHYAKELTTILSIVMRHPSYIKKYLTVRNAIKYSANSLSQESDFLLNLFCESTLQPRRYSTEQLRMLAQDDAYKCFVAGSDQIWAGNRKMEDVFFLSFAPTEKRIAFAPSFGTEKIDDYNQRSFKREISKFSKLSAREESGQKIIRNLTGRDVPRIADPTFLKTTDEWAVFAKDSQAYKKIASQKYIFVHFLDKPNDIVLQCLKYLSDMTGHRIIGFAYPQDALCAVCQYQLIDGNPVDYVALIEHAEYVVTDSFHTTLFSVVFNTKFFTFVRQYRHESSQQTRITTLLKLFGYTDRLIQNIEEFKTELRAELHQCDAILERERTKARDYLNNAIGIASDETREAVSKDGTTKIMLANEKNCTGCLACLAACEKGAIRIEVTKAGYEIPKIDPDFCVSCRRCQSVCVVKNNDSIKWQDNPKEETNEKSAYVAYNNDENLRFKAASGGAFAALATGFLRDGGVVFGVRLYFEDGLPVIKHVPVENESELSYILQSKYVQSDASSAYRQIKILLENNKKVLFCGTSCQVDALYRYLEKNGSPHVANLFTIDLICHGVPGRKFFQDYIQMVEKKNKSKLNDFTFRLKDNLHKRILYQETWTMSPDRGKEENKFAPANKSSYYRLFLGEESYRNACYECKYASINKPADITIGDYFELAQDYPEIYSRLLQQSIWDINSLIIHTSQGKKLVRLAGELITTYNVDLKKVQASHKQLCKPSQHTMEREKILKIYSEKGFSGIDAYYRKRDMIMYLPIKLKRMVFR